MTISFTKIAIIPLVLMFIFMGCSSLEEDKNIENIPDLPDQEGFRTTIILTREGKKVALVWANRVQTFEKKKETHLKDSISVDFYNDKGQHRSLLTAKEGIVYNMTYDMMAIGNVKVLSDSGWVLLTERLRWDNQNQKVISDTSCVFITDKDTLYGDYFESDPNLTQYVIKNTRGVSRRKVQF